MLRQSFFYFIFFIYGLTVSGKDAPETFSIKGDLSADQKATYEHWVKSVISAFNAIGSGDVKFVPVIQINSKKNSWPFSYSFYDEAFYSVQPSSFNKDKISFTPIKEVVGLSNNEYTFKYLIANHLISNHFGKNIPYFFEKGLSSYLASKSGGTNWITRNYSFLLFLSTERKETKSIGEILNFKSKYDNKERYLQEAYSWALIDWLMNQKDYLDSPQLILALSNLQNKQSFENVIKLNSNWNTFLDSNYWSHLPKEIKVSAEYKTVINEDDLQALFLSIKKKNIIISSDNIASMIGYTIHPETLENIKRMVKDIRPVVREVAVKALGLIPDRNSLPTLIEASYADVSEEVRYESAKAISKLNFQIAPKALVNSISLNDPVSVGQVAMALANVGDPAPAKNLIQKLNSIRPVTSYIAITNSRNYVADYDVVDGAYDPIVKTYHEGVVLEVTVLWVTVVKANLIAALNKLPLNNQGDTDEAWFKWYASQ